MKRFAGMMGALLLMPTLAMASGDMVSISELRQQGEAMGRWTKTYETHGRTIEMDIPIYIPNEKELAVYDCSAYTDYIKNPNDEDKTNVYTYYENLSELVGEDTSGNAEIDVYNDGTKLRIMLNNPEELLLKRKKTILKLKKMDSIRMNLIGILYMQKTMACHWQRRRRILRKPLSISLEMSITELMLTILRLLNEEEKQRAILMKNLEIM